MATETEVFGNFYIKRSNYVYKGKHGDPHISTKTVKNRTMFVDCLHQNELVATNTTFDKPNGKLITCKEKVPEHNPESEVCEGFNTEPSNYKKYAQCDYLLTRKKGDLECERHRSQD